MGMGWDKFFDVPLTVSPMGNYIVNGTGTEKEEEEDDDDDGWEDVDIDAEELKITAARPWKEELD